MRLPTIIWRFTGAELWRLLLLTTVVFVSVVAFAVTVKPLADGDLGPLDAIKFMLFAMPPMLQYALPFAAGFGTTLAYHRFASQNESLAAHAGGVSHRSLLFPAIASGLVLGAMLLGLTNSVIPRFLRSMEEMVTEDATRLLINKINRGHAIRMGEYLVFAETATEVPPDAGTTYKFLLTGLMIVRMDGQTIAMEASALKATAWIIPDGGDSSDAASGTSKLVVTAEDIEGRSEHNVVRNEKQDLPSIVIPTAFTDDPKFLSGRSLRELREAPERMKWIERPRRDLAAALGQRASLAELKRRWREEGVVTLIDHKDDRWEVFGSGMYPSLELGQMIAPVGGDADAGVRVVHHRAGVPNIYLARQGSIRVRGTPSEPTLVSIQLSLHQFGTEHIEATDGLRPGDLPTVEERAFNKLRLPDNPADQFLGMSVDELTSLADARLERFPEENFIRGPRDDLRRRVDDLMNEITSKQQERWAVSAACFVMVLTGAVMALRLKNSTPLVVYLWSFFPALGAVLTISAGQQAIHNNGLSGMPLLWGGVIGLAAFTILEFRKLARY